MSWVFVFSCPLNLIVPVVFCSFDKFLCGFFLRLLISALYMHPCSLMYYTHVVLNIVHPQPQRPLLWKPLIINYISSTKLAKYFGPEYFFLLSSNLPLCAIFIGKLSLYISISFLFALAVHQCAFHASVCINKLYLFTMIIHPHVTMYLALVSLDNHQSCSKTPSHYQLSTANASFPCVTRFLLLQHVR
jgi:hypothetical protein